MVSSATFSSPINDYGMEKKRCPQQPPMPYDVEASTKMSYSVLARRFNTKSKPIPLFLVRIRAYITSPILADRGNSTSCSGFAPTMAEVR